MTFIVKGELAHVRGLNEYRKLGEVRGFLGKKVDPTLAMVESQIIDGNNLIEAYLEGKTNDEIPESIAMLGIAVNAVLPKELQHPRPDLTKRIGIVGSFIPAEPFSYIHGNLDENGLAILAQDMEDNPKKYSDFAASQIAHKTLEALASIGINDLGKYQADKEKGLVLKSK
jgi:hypothetical protein